MEKLSSVTGFTSGSKSFDLLHTKNELEKKRKTYNSVNLAKLPDKGARLKSQIDELEDLLKTLNIKADEDSHDESNVLSTTADEDTALKINKDIGVQGKELKHNTKNKCEKKVEHQSTIVEKENVPFCKNLLVSGSAEFLSFSDLTPKQATKKAVENNAMDSPSFKGWREPEKAGRILLTEAKPLVEESVAKSLSQKLFSSNPVFQPDEECVKKIHNSLLTFPEDSKEESEPEDLKSSLLLHQKRGLAWMMWREQQEPSGGILADDMGLGKTLSVISLILKQKERNDYSAFNRDKRECRGTLIVCLASIIKQWEEEIRKHCEYDALKVLLFHGPKREKSVKKIMSYDVVLTTYNIVLSEKKALDASKSDSPLFTLNWERIVLDEAHTIKNHASQTAQAIFCLRGFRRWAVTGTPIHNVFKDVYSLVKFLQFSPFDDLKKFKGLTDDSSESSEKRRNLLIKSILLRRTKEQVDEWGKPLIEMKNKQIRLCYIDLSDEERKIYDKLNEKARKKFDQFIEKTAKFRSSTSLLVLLLRLQQCCNHLSLLANEIEELDDSSDVADIFSSLSICENSSNSVDSGLDLTFNEIPSDKLNDQSVKSTKIKELFKELHKVFESSDNRDKCVIVSQWVSMLEIVAFHLEQEDIPYYLIAGSTKVDDRQAFAEDFNYNDDGVKVMLLSLRAGGVGLNLIGGNHLFLLDLHWNPALEMQACDRIHRVGQKKDVVIHKFVCKNTIEEKIKDLQDSKRRVASSALHGAKQVTKGLTIEDFKMLFSVKK